MGLDFKPAAESPSPSSTSTKSLDERAVEDIVERLSKLPDLHLPFALSSKGDSLTQADKKSHLHDLLHRDASIFLERHGPKLNASELQEFDVLNSDYEVNWHLKQLRSAVAPLSDKDQKAHASLVKNRRLAYMDKLIRDGDFFSEDSMRMRAPLLYHEYLGQFQDPFERAFSRPGEKWSEMLIRQGEEDEYQARLKIERENADMVEEEVDEDEDEDNDDNKDEKLEDIKEDDDQNEKGKGTEDHSDANAELQNRISDSSLTYEERQQIKLEDFTRYMHDKFISGESSSKPTLSKEEIQSKMDDFMRIMQEKFLAGEDSAHFDYVCIDHDSALDDYWLEEISQDAEDKYFDDD